MAEGMLSSPSSGAYSGPVIDACVHNSWVTQDDIVDYMTVGWQEYVAGPARRAAGRGFMPLLPSLPYTHPGGEHLPSARPGGGSPGSDYDTLRSEVLGVHPASRAVLSFDDLAFTQSLPNAGLAREIARAANDWMVDRWLSGDDDRLYGLALVSSQEPEAAADELRRVGGRDRIVGVLLSASGLARPYGHPIYDPIFRIAHDLDLTIVIRCGGDAVPEVLSHPAAGGLPETYSAYRLLGAQTLMTHVVSLIGEGVFVKFPGLRVLLTGGGVAWIPSLIWRYDTEYRSLRRDAPWLDGEPSEYFRRHIRVTTYPLDQPAEPERLVKLLGAFRGIEEIICFASGYPRWDADVARDVADRLPGEWLSRIFYENAIQLFRWGRQPIPPRGEVSRKVVDHQNMEGER
jgi:uncharacterized protein